LARHLLKYVTRRPSRAEEHQVTLRDLSVIPTLHLLAPYTNQNQFYDSS
jgi:hypothetical protein